MGIQKKLVSIISFLIVFLSLEIYAQTEIPSPAKNIAELDEKPDFPGGIQEFYKFIRDNYQTPKVQGLAGKIFMTFIIEKDGSLSDIKVLRDIGYNTGKEAIRILQNSPKWIPGKYKGEAVRVSYSLPINIQSAEKFVEKIYTVGEVFEKPKYPGGLQNFYIDLSKHFKAPEKEGLKGKIIIGFIIEKDGSVVETKILKDIGYGTGEEAMRSIKLIKKWIPGKLDDGTTVRTAYSLPISVQEEQ